jgi:hypothetical protein
MSVRKCYGLYCNKNTLPMIPVFLLFSLGFIIAFVYEYILLILYAQGIMPILCLNGIHLHHLYFGLFFTLVFGLLFLKSKEIKRKLLWIALTGLGLGLFFSDIISHLTWDIPFSLFC